jgi:hypothetical protein
VYPDPDGEMYFPPVKQLFHRMFHVFRHVPKLDMVDPTLCSIFGERIIQQAIFGDGFVKV